MLSKRALRKVSYEDIKKDIKRKAELFWVALPGVKEIRYYRLKRRWKRIKKIREENLDYYYYEYLDIIREAAKLRLWKIDKELESEIKEKLAWEPVDKGIGWAMDTIIRIIGEYKIRGWRDLIAIMAYDKDPWSLRKDDIQEAIKKLGYKDKRELCESLWREEKENFMEFLEKAGRSKYGGAKLSVARIIGELEAEELGDVVKELLEDKDREVRAYAIGGAYKLRKKNPGKWKELWEKAEKEAEEMAKSEDWEVREGVAKAIEEDEIEELIHLLVRLALDKEKAVKEAAQEAIKKLGDENVGKLYESLSEEEKEKVLAKLRQLESAGAGEIAKILNCEAKELPEEIVEAFVS